MEYPRIALKVGPKDFQELVDLGNKVEAALTGNANYGTPVPSLATIGASCTAVQDAITKWGPKGNRGSHADYLDLVQKALILHLQLKDLADYCSVTAGEACGSDYATLQAVLVTSGFDLAAPKSLHGRLEAVRNFRNFSSRKVSKNQVKLDWKRPLNTVRSSDVKYTEIRRSTTPDFNASIVVGTTTRSEFVDTNITGTAIQYYYWAIPYNSYGAGVVSEAVTVTLAAAA